MDISSISRCYTLKPITVLPEQLLVDPKNPRIVLDIDSDFPNAFTQDDADQLAAILHDTFGRLN